MILESLLNFGTNRFPVIKLKQPIKILLVEDVSGTDQFHREIDELRRLFFPYEIRGYFKVIVLSGENVTYQNLEKALSECHIAHFATHVYRQGEDQYININYPYQNSFRFTAGDVKKDIHSVPHLVFMNGCYSGEPEGFAEAFISKKSGTKIFVGSYGAITSPMAANCALWFYQHLIFDGLPAGEALLETREDTEAFYRDKYGERIYAHIPYVLHGNPATRILLSGRFLDVRSIL